MLFRSREGKFTDFLESSKVASMAEKIGGAVLKGLIILAAAISSLFRLRKDLNGERKDQQLSTTATSALSNGLAAYGQVSGSSVVEVVRAGLAMVPSGYGLYSEGYVPGVAVEEKT